MSAPVIKSSKMVSKVDETKRPKSTATTFKRDNSAVFYKRWSKTVTATLSVLVQISVFKLSEWTGYTQNRVDGFYDNLMFTSNKWAEKLTSAIRVAGRILGVVIAELFDTLYELSGVDLVAAISDVVRGDVVTGPNYLESIARASNATFAAEVMPPGLSTARVGYVLGGKPSHKEQKNTRLSLQNNSDLTPLDSNVKPNILRTLTHPSQVVNEQTEKCQEIIIINTPQIPNNSDLTPHGSNTGPKILRILKRPSQLIDDQKTIERKEETKTRQEIITNAPQLINNSDSKRCDSNAGPKIVRILKRPCQLIDDKTTTERKKETKRRQEIVTNAPQLPNNSDSTRHGSKATPKILRILKRPSQLIDDQTVTKRKEKTEKHKEIMITPQLPNNSDSTGHGSKARPKILRILKRPSQLIDDQTVKKEKTKKHKETIIKNTPQSKVLKIEELTYDSLTIRDLPIASRGPDDMVADTAVHVDRGRGTTTTTMTTERRHDDTPANRDRTTPGRYRTKSRHWRSFATSTAAGHLDDSGDLPTWSPAWTDDRACRPQAPNTGVPPPPGLVPLSHGLPGPFAGPPPSGHEPFWHGFPGPFAGPPPPGCYESFSHGFPGPFVGPPPPGCYEPFSHGFPDPFAGPPPPGYESFLHGFPEPFGGPLIHTGFSREGYKIAHPPTSDRPW